MPEFLNGIGSSEMEMKPVELARRISARRIERKMTLNQMEQLSKLTRGMLSKVENLGVTHTDVRGSQP